MSDFLSDSLWVEKYRPNELKDVVLPDEYKLKFEQFIIDGIFPHLLFYGGAGGGKSTIARILVEKTADPDDVLMFNGSSSTGIDFIRDVVEEFVKTPTFGSKVKIVYIDEFDQLSNAAQVSLKNTMETYCDNARFILTTNYYFKVKPEIVSRCQTFEFKQLSKEYINNLIDRILISETVESNPKIIEKIVNTYYPDVRRMIGSIQQNTVNGKLVENGNEIDKNENGIIYYLDSMFRYFKDTDGAGDFNQGYYGIYELIKTTEIDYPSLYTKIFQYPETPIWIIPTLSRYADKTLSCFSQPLNFMAFMADFIECGRKYLEIKR
jgi:replication-associated recombination protein RarA